MGETYKRRTRRTEKQDTGTECEKGTIIHNGSEDCTGLIIVEEGQLRAYTLSEDGKEITLYRMFQRDACLLRHPVL